MRKQQEDDWGRSLGSDPDAPVVRATPKKVAKQDSLSGLINYFSNLLPTDSWGTLNSPVNTKAMMAGVSKLRKADVSPETIRAMMNEYILEITRKPLPAGIAPWRGFLANLDSLASKVTATNLKEPTSYEDLQTDTRRINPK